MSLARMHIAAFLLVLGLCNAESTGSGEIKVNDSLAIERTVADDAGADTSAKAAVDSAEEEAVEENLPILPPLILLDFDNGTADDNATADEKSKRTVNNGLGYGFDRNSLLAPRKYNYYFPAGKTGTTVSIEESISPFLPRTIIERARPRPVTGESHEKPGQQGSFSGSASDRRSRIFRYYISPTAKSQPTFGLRTKLTKTTNSYQRYPSIIRPSVKIYSNEDYRNGAYASTTSRPLAYSSTEATGHVTSSPQSYMASSAYTYVTPVPTTYEEPSQSYLGQGSQHTINVQGYSRAVQSVDSSTASPEGVTYLENVDVRSRTSPRGYVRPGSNVVEPSSPGSAEVSGYVESAGPFADLPRYTVENGVRYENKIFWKYPDGRVSDVPPMTYETYSEYPAALQAGKPQVMSVYESASTENSVLSQGPVQFPMAPESGAPPSPFISAESLSKLPQQQVYRLGYQNLVGHKQAVAQQVKASSGVSAFATPSPPRNSFRTNRKNQKSRYETSGGPVSRYMVNSPNAEYTDSYTTQSTPRSTTPSSFFPQTVGSNLPRQTTASGKNLESYSNLQYSDLLNYNPSISQYIKNPASILNVQPTFVQAGSSLIPVIILRVDGVPPIQPKATPNVNLKALLQQYLVQYANSIEELARPSNYDLGDDLTKEQNSFSINHLRELARLAQSTGRDLIANPTESYLGRSSYDTSNLNAEKSLPSGKYGQRTAARPKVKSVQIVEDPRFPNYREKN
ncbi:PREDICTED: uncharacterized protein LOC106740936 [Dinoponera quadriceps]|uniref:Uncharacterized protein LOC106740936 n=1 Tax=Dinoponera quadriceps TaxID=609295 RepID=A0A6P3WPW9_DINQU|nr:PREDICTED: uncharacterized protein LOC106740936 [Dinoponera quadriceps]